MEETSSNLLKPHTHEHFMRIALNEAKKAFNKDEVPVGAVIVYKNRIIAKAHNLTEQLTDFTAHAEMQTLSSAGSFLGHKYLNECTLYITLEPCIMCAGAAFWTRIGKIVYGASDTKRGFSRLQENILHPSTTIESGVLEEECSMLLRTFFQSKR